MERTQVPDIYNLDLCTSRLLPNVVQSVFYVNTSACGHDMRWRVLVALDSAQPTIVIHDSHPRSSHDDSIKSRRATLHTEPIRAKIESLSRNESVFEDYKAIKRSSQQASCIIQAHGPEANVEIDTPGPSTGRNTSGLLINNLHCHSIWSINTCRAAWDELC